MTVGQLIDELSQYPEDMDVFLAERKSDFDFGLLNSVNQAQLNFKEDSDGETTSTLNCVILDEE